MGKRKPHPSRLRGRGVDVPKALFYIQNIDFKIEIRKRVLNIILHKKIVKCIIIHIWMFYGMFCGENQ